MRLALAILLTALPLAAQQCDRVCLRDMLDQYLAALVKHDPTAAPISSQIRFTEDGVEMPLGQGLWKTATGLGNFRLDLLDVEKSTAGAYATVIEDGKPVHLVLRLKIFGLRIHEIETMVVRNPTMRLEAIASTPLYERLSREELIQAANTSAGEHKARIAAVVETSNIVWLRVDYGQYVAWEMLQVQDKRVVVIGSISKPMPPGSPSGWD